MKRFKKAMCVLLAAVCLLSLCAVALPVRAEADAWTELSTVSTDGIVENNDTNWRYVLIDGTTGDETPLVYGLYSDYPAMIVSNPAANDKYARLLANGGSHPANSGDIAAVYTADAAGVVDLTLTISKQAASGDGVVVSIYRKPAEGEEEELLPAATYTATASKAYSVKRVSVSVGDQFYFRLNKNAAISNDGGTFVAKVQTTQVSTKSPSGITANNTTQWSYVYINSSTGAESEMVYNASGTYGAGMYINNPASNDQYARLLANAGSHPANSGDIAAVYTVLDDGYVDCAVTAKVANSGGDGVNVKIWINNKTNYILPPTRVQYTDGTTVYTVPAVRVSAGDKIYFGLDKNSGLSSDGGSFLGEVKTASAYPATGSTYPGEVISGNVDYGFSHYHISEDFIERKMNYNVSGSPYMNGNSGKSYNLTATDAGAFFNDKYQAGAAASGYAARVYTVPADGTVTVDYTAVANDPAGYKGDGFSIALALNDYAMGGLADWQYMTETEAKAGTVKSFQQSLNVQAGDKIYFLLSKKGGPSGTYKSGYDVAKLHTAVTYTSLAAVTEEAHSAGDTCLMLPVAGKTYNSYTAIAATAKANYSFARIDKNTNTLHPLAYSESGANKFLRVTNSTASSDYYGYFGSNYGGGTAADCDIAAIYTAPVKMNVDIIANGLFAKSGNGDGVNVYVYKNSFNFKLGEHYYAPGAGALYAYTISNVTLNEGDRIFVVLNCNGTIGYDGGSFTAQIKCNSINPGTAATAPASPAHPGTIQGGKIYLDPTTVGDLIDGFTDESFVNVKDTSGEYLTRYATVRTGDQVMIDGVAHTAVISGDSNGTGKTNAADVASLRSKLAGNSLTTLGELAFANDTSVASLVRRIKEVANGTYDYLNAASETLLTSPAFAVDATDTEADPFAVNLPASAFATARISVTNASDTNYGRLYYQTDASDDYNSVPFYFGAGDETVSLALTKTTLFAGTIRNMYVEFPALTSGNISGTVKLVSESKYHAMQTVADSHIVLFTDMAGRSVKSVNLDALTSGQVVTLDETNTIWSHGPIDSGIDDIKVRYTPAYPQGVVLVASSGGYIGAVNYQTGETIYSTNVSTSLANATLYPHGIEMLPNGDIVVACSGGDSASTDPANGRILYYQKGVGGYSLTSNEILLSAHGVIWDDANDVLWALGMNGLFAYTVNGEGVLTLDGTRGYTLAACGGHALAEDGQNSDYLWIATANNKVLRFSKTTNTVDDQFTYSDMPTGANGVLFAHAMHVKGIGVFSDGTIVYTCADGVTVNETLYAEATDRLRVIDSTGQREYIFADVAMYDVCAVN